MDNSTRLQYLEAMGIAVWLPRAVVDHQPTPNPESVDSWDILQAEAALCTLCDLCKIRSQTVFGAGNDRADWMLVGEAPGQSEDQQGLPFVGKSGLLLTEMLRAIGLDRKEAFITNAVKCRPPGNRTPKTVEIQTCNTYLLRQLAHIKPKIILALGHVAAQALLGTDQPMAELRGKIHALNDTPVVVVYHPAYLLKSLPDKHKAWEDLKLAMQTYTHIKG